MRRVEPRPGSIDYQALALSAEEGFLLSRVEGVTDTRELVALTGLPPEEVDRIVDRLHALGVVSARDDATPRRESFLPPPRESVAPGPRVALARVRRVGRDTSGRPGGGSPRQRGTSTKPERGG
ncbi:MAG: hypothetical protein IPQ09_22280 [Myxococcales bacterium]|nr:hypothetical protein [Myxococcales bacterium]